MRRNGDRGLVGGDREILDRGYGFHRTGDRWLPDRWLGMPYQGPPPDTVTGYTLSGPASGNVGVASTPFTVALLPVGGTLTGSVTITPSDQVAGGTFTPSTVNLTTAAPSATFTYTPGIAGARTISCTNNKGLTNPTPLTYAAASPGLNDGDPVALWKDSSTNGNDASQTGAARPTFKTNIVNGKPVVRYASGQFLNLTTPLTNVQPWVLFAVMKPAGAVDLWSLTKIGQTSYSGLTALQHRLDDYMISSSDQFVGYYPPAGFGSAFHVYTIKALVPSTPAEFHVDGTAYTITPQGFGAADVFNVLGQGAGDIAELIWYNADVQIDIERPTRPTPQAVGDRANIEAYLGNKYGISVASGTPVDPSTIPNLVAWWKADSLG